MINLCSIFCLKFNHSITLRVFLRCYILNFCINVVDLIRLDLTYSPKFVFCRIDKANCIIIHQTFHRVFPYKKAICVTVYCVCVKHKKFCNCHSSFFFFFFSFWQRLFSKFCPIVVLSACDQDRSL